MNLTKEQKIQRLRDGIASEATPEHVKKEMQEMIVQLEKPEPAEDSNLEPPQIKKEKPSKPARKPAKVDDLPHVVYLRDNNIEKSIVVLGKTLYNQCGSIAYAARNGKGNFISQSERLIEKIKSHVSNTSAATSPEPAVVVDSEMSNEEKEAVIAAAAQKKAKAKEKIQKEEDEAALADAKAKKEDRIKKRAEQ